MVGCHYYYHDYYVRARSRPAPHAYACQRLCVPLRTQHPDVLRRIRRETDTDDVTTATMMATFTPNEKTAAGFAKRELCRHASVGI